MGIFSGVDEILNSAKNGSFDEILSKTKAVAEETAKKSAERLEISKKKIELLDSKTKLTKAYEKFGKLQYSAYVGEAVDEDEITSVIEEIQLHKSRADMLAAEVDDLKKAFMDSIAKGKEAFRDVVDKSNDIVVTAVEPDEE